MSIQIPNDFEAAVEAAIEKNETVLSKLTLTQLKEVLGDKYESYQVTFYLKEYRRLHKPVSKARQFRALEEENESLKAAIRVALADIESGLPLEVIIEELQKTNA